MDGKPKWKYDNDEFTEDDNNNNSKNNIKKDVNINASWRGDSDVNIDNSDEDINASWKGNNDILGDNGNKDAMWRNSDSKKIIGDENWPANISDSINSEFNSVNIDTEDDAKDIIPISTSYGKEASRIRTSIDTMKFPKAATGNRGMKSNSRRNNNILVKSVTSLEKTALDEYKVENSLKMTLAPEGYFYLKEINGIESNTSSDINFSVTYCGSQIPFDPLVNIGDGKTKDNIDNDIDVNKYRKYSGIDVGYNRRTIINGNVLKKRKINQKPSFQKKPQGFEDHNANNSFSSKQYRHLPREYADESYSMTNPYGGPVPVLGIQKTLKPQMLKMQGEMDFDDDKTNKSRNARNADGWKEGPTWKASNRQKRSTNRRRQYDESSDDDNDTYRRRKQAKANENNTHKISFKEQIFRTEDGTEFNLDDLYVPPPRKIEKQLADAENEKQRNIDRAFDIMCENKDALRREIEERHREKEEKREESSNDVETKEESIDSTSSESDEEEDLPPLSRGDRVKARLRGWRKPKSGSISQVKERDNTYSILFDDGKRKSDIERNDIELIMSLSGRTQPSPKAKRGGSRRTFSDDSDTDSDDSDDDEVSISKGDRVEAKLKGWTKYYKGKITRENRDGTYDILFDDGERKSKVDSALVKKLTQETINNGNSHVRVIRSTKARKKFKLGQRVECTFNGGKRLKPGKILRINVDSTYDILFDSGERELRINEGEIKLLSSSSGSSLGGGMGSLGELQEIEESEEDDDSGW